MKNQLILIAFLITFIVSSCEKENMELNYDCLKSYITYTEDNEYNYHEKYYYKNNLIVRVDCSSRYVWNYKYDDKGNLIKFESEKGSYTLCNYDSENRCIQSEQYFKDTLYSKTHKFYSDTLLTKEIYLNKNGDTSSIVDYYYGSNNRIDSVISNRSKTYHYYSSDSHGIIKLDPYDNKHFESITTYENGLVSKYEEFYYYENGILHNSFLENRNYDGNNNLIKSVIEQFDLYSNSNRYDEIRYSYDSENKMIKSEAYDANGNRLSCIEYIYDGDNLVKKQLFDSDGNKSEYTIVENTCNS